MSVILENMQTGKEIDPEQFRQDYQKLPQSTLMRKYKITSTTLMRLIRQFVPPNERYGARMRNGLIAVGAGNETR